MLSLVVGAAASGKSAFAEKLTLSLPGQRIYVATMPPWDDECRERIARHRARRAGLGFCTMERYRDLGGLEVPSGSNVLLDCLGNLLANELYGSSTGDEPVANHVADKVQGDRPQAILPPAPPPAPLPEDAAVDAVVSGVLALAARCAHLSVVSNEVGSAGTAYEGDTLTYLRALGLANRLIAARADFVCEVVAGMPNVLKGSLPLLG